MNKKEIMIKIGVILWRDWDPIGINHSGSDDEYLGYVPVVYRKIISGTNLKGMSDLLSKLETSSIGVEGNRDRCDLVANKILNLIK